jgi:hypothetical protein
VHRCNGIRWTEANEDIWGRQSIPWISRTDDYVSLLYSMYQSHNLSFCSASVVAGRILSVVLHSTLASELSSSCSHPPSSANQRCSNAPAAPLQSATPHSHHAFRCTDNRPTSSSSSSNWARTATPDLPLVELQLPPVKLLILQQSVEQQPATISSTNGTPTALLPIPKYVHSTPEKLLLSQLCM